MNQPGKMALGLGLALVLVPMVSATQGSYRLPDFMAMSTDVIVGVVESSESRWAANNTQIVTDVTIEVGQVLKGDQNKNGSVHLQLPTGRVGAIVRSSPDLPTFTVGEEVLVFLSKQPKRGFSIVGGDAGKYRILPNPRTGEKYVVAESQAAHINLESEAAAMAAEKIEEDADTPAPRSMKVQFDRRSLVKLEDFAKHLIRLEKRREAVAVHAAAPQR